MDSYKLGVQQSFDEKGCGYYSKIYLYKPSGQELIPPFSNVPSLTWACLRLGNDLNHFDFSALDAEERLKQAIENTHSDIEVDVSDFVDMVRRNPMRFSEQALDGRE
jgi:hypothetical protein